MADCAILSLCTGYGGLELGLHAAVPGSRTVCYVEREAQAAAILAARMEEGRLDKAPVWSDLTTFDARPWRGAVDLVAGGFPCQPVSLAGKRLGQADPRWLWPHVLRVLLDSGASVGFFENVPGLRTKGLEDVLRSLAAAGFDAEWGVYGAYEVAAPHKRDRLFVLAYADRGRLEGLRGSRVLDRKRTSQRNNPDRRGGQVVEHPASSRLEGGRQGLSWPPGPEDDWSGWDGPQPAICRDADGAAGGMDELPRRDRLCALGNGVVPPQAASAFNDLCSQALREV